MSPTVATSSCTLNGQPVPCAEFTHAAGTALKWGLGGLTVFLIIAILVAIFWIAMLVHAAKHEVPHRAIWIIAMLVTGVLGAVVYYFAVKRDYAAPAPVQNQVPPSEPPVTPAA